MQKVPSSPLVLLHDVGADPADAGAGLVALGGGPRGGRLEVGGVAEAVAALDDVELHEHHSLRERVEGTRRRYGRPLRLPSAALPYLPCRHAVFRPRRPAPPVSSPDGERADRQAGGARAARGAAGARPRRPRRRRAARRRGRRRARPGWPPSWPRRADAPVLRGAASQGRTPPVRAARRRPARAPARAPGGPERLRAAARPPRAAAARARRAGRATSDRATLFEALRCALAALGHALVLLDDLQWSDEATLEVLAALAEPVTASRLLIVGSLPLRRAAARPRPAPPAQRPAPRGPARGDPAAAARARRDARARRARAPARAGARRSCVRSTTAPRACRSSRASSPSRCA